MKIYTIIGGVNGVGKISFTGVLKETRFDLGTIIDVDKITATNNLSPIQGGKEALQRIDNCLEKDYTFTQETTLSGNKTEITARKAKENGYYVRLYYVGLDTVDESIERIKNRVKKGGHNINTEDVKRRFESRFEAVKKVLPYCDEAEFYDNNNGFVKVAEYKNGELVLVGNKDTEWIKQLEIYLSFGE